MKKQSGYLYHCAQNREAAKAAVAAAQPDLNAQEQNQAVMKRLGEMWGALDAAEARAPPSPAVAHEHALLRAPAPAAEAAQPDTAGDAALAHRLALGLRDGGRSPVPAPAVVKEHKALHPEMW